MMNSRLSVDLRPKQNNKKMKYTDNTKYRTYKIQKIQCTDNKINRKCQKVLNTKKNRFVLYKIHKSKVFWKNFNFILKF